MIYVTRHEFAPPSDASGQESRSNLRLAVVILSDETQNDSQGDRPSASGLLVV
jgi:hypothetical protein